MKTKNVKSGTENVKSDTKIVKLETKPRVQVSPQQVRAMIENAAHDDERWIKLDHAISFLKTLLVMYPDDGNVQATVPQLIEEAQAEQKDLHASYFRTWLE